MATDERTEPDPLQQEDPEMWDAQDKFAVCCLKHVMGNRHAPMGVTVTKNWTEIGLQTLQDRHLRIAETATKASNHWRFYKNMKAEPELWIGMKLASYPHLQSCVDHMGMMYKWEKDAPVFLVPDMHLKRIRRYIE